MDQGRKRSRGSNWDHNHTKVLAELKRSATLRKEDGRQVWEQIAVDLSNRFPALVRTGNQCRRRWDTLVKVYNHIEDYCVQTGTDGHRALDEDELASMKLDTAYHSDWYDIVNEVCSRRKRKERSDGDPMLEKRKMEPGPGSRSVRHPERPPSGDTLHSAPTEKSVTHNEQSTLESTAIIAPVSSSSSFEVITLRVDKEAPRLKDGSDVLEREQPIGTCAQASSNQSQVIDKLSPEIEVVSLVNGSDGGMIGFTQFGQPGQVALQDSLGVSQESQALKSGNPLPITFPAENGDKRLMEQLQDDRWDWREAMPFEISAQTVLPEAESDWDLKLWDFGSDCIEISSGCFRRRAPRACPSYVSDEIEGRGYFPAGFADEAAPSLSSVIVRFAKHIYKLIHKTFMASCTSSRSATSTITAQCPERLSPERERRASGLARDSDTTRKEPPQQTRRTSI